MGFSCCKKEFTKSEFKNGTPSFEYDQEPIKLFQVDDGLLFRLVNKKKGEWAYYNDSTNYDMHVKVTFKEDCHIQALGNTTLTALNELKPGENPGKGACIAEVMVPPGGTCPFIKGHVNGFDAKVEAIPRSAGDDQKKREREREGINQ